MTTEGKEAKLEGNEELEYWGPECMSTLITDGFSWPSA